MRYSESQGFGVPHPRAWLPTSTSLAENPNNETSNIALLWNCQWSRSSMAGTILFVLHPLTILAGREEKSQGHFRARLKRDRIRAVVERSHGPSRAFNDCTDPMAWFKMQPARITRFFEGGYPHQLLANPQKNYRKHLFCKPLRRGNHLPPGPGSKFGHVGWHALRYSEGRG